MIKVLIIEDNVEKLRRISSLLEQDCNIPDDDIDCADNITQGRGLMSSNQYDLLLLDLVLPIRENDEPTSEAGVKFLEEIYYNPNINIPIHIIGLTEFETVFRNSLQEFEDKLWGLINFNLQNSDWVYKLRDKVFYLQSFKKKYKDFIEEFNRYDVAIITALNKEFKQLLNTQEWQQFTRADDNLVYYRLILNTRNNNNIKIIACCINQMGMQASAAVTSKIISLFSPSKLFLVGICAGLQNANTNLGDIIVATQCWDYESGKISENQNGILIFQPDMHCLTSDQGLISKLADFSNNKVNLSNIYNTFQGNKPNTQLKVYFGSVGTGPYVLSSKNYLNELIEKDRKLIGIDMEGYGVYKAAQFYKSTDAIFIKAISDYGDIGKNDNFQEYSAFVSAKFVIEFLYNFF